MRDSTVILTANRLENLNPLSIIKSFRKLYPLGQIIAAYSGVHPNIIEITPKENEGHDIIVAFKERIRPRVYIISHLKNTEINSVSPKQSTIYVKKRTADAVGIIEQAGKVISFSFETPNEWTGVAALMGEELKILQKIVAESHRLFLFEILNKVIFNGGDFVVEHS